MKALNLYGKQDVRLEDIDLPQIDNDNDVIIKVKVAGICGSDISRFGKIGSYNPGLTWGLEFSGTVANVGKNVTNCIQGDKVTACNCFPCNLCEYCQTGQCSRCINLKVLGGHVKGAFAEYIKVPSSNVVKVLKNIDYETASFIEPSSVVVHGYNRINIKKGDKVAIIGCGTIGLLAVQWAKIFGASVVYAFDNDNYKLDVAQQTGADFTFNVLDEQHLKQFMNITDQKGANVVIESSGSVSGIANALLMAVKGGTVLLLGIPYGDVFLARLNFETIIRSELKVIGSWNSMSSPFPGKEWQTSLTHMNDGSINIKPLITHKISFEQASDMFEKLYNRKESFIKVLIIPDKNAL